MEEICSRLCFYSAIRKIILCYTELLVESLQQRYVDLEVLIVVADVDESAEELVREDQLESLSVLFNGVQESEEAETQNLYFVLCLHIVSWVLALNKR